MKLKRKLSFESDEDDDGRKTEDKKRLVQIAKTQGENADKDIINYLRDTRPEKIERNIYLLEGSWQETEVEKELKNIILKKLRLSSRLLKCFNRLYLEKFVQSLKSNHGETGNSATELIQGDGEESSNSEEIF